MNTELHYIVAVDFDSPPKRFTDLMERFHPFFHVFQRFYLLHPHEPIHIDDLAALVEKTIPEGVRFYIGVCPSGAVFPTRQEPSPPPASPPE